MQSEFMTGHLSDDWIVVIKKLEYFFDHGNFSIDKKVKNQVDFFFSNLRWTVLEKEENGVATIAYADNISYEEKAEECIKRILKSGFLQLFGVHYDIELVPIGEVLDEL